MKRSLLLAAFIALSCSAVFALPKFRLTSCAMNMDVPEYMGLWTTRAYSASEKERKTLAPDTEFSKAVCYYPRKEEMSLITGEAPYDSADLSIVLSGQDLANSIHRPERCLPAQGHEIFDSKPDKMTLQDGREIPLRRLLSVQSMENDKGDILHRKAVTYYFFVGHDRLTADHSKRTLMDIENRLFHGQAERWAYVSVTMGFTDKAEKGGLPTLEMADDKARNLLAELSKNNIDWKMVPR